MRAQGFHAPPLGQVNVFALGKHRVDQPRVNPQQLAKALGNLFIGLEMVRLAAHRPAGVQRRQQVLLVQVFQHAGRAGRQVVVEQNSAGIEVFQPQPAVGANQGLQHQALAVGQLHRGRLRDVRVERAKPHIQAGLVKNLLELQHIGQVGRVARVVFGHHQQVARFRADFLNRGHGRLHRQRHHLRRQVVPAARKQVGVNRRELEAGVANIDRTVKRRRVLHPFKTEPALDGRCRVQDALLKLVDGAGQGGDEVRNHAATFDGGYRYLVR